MLSVKAREAADHFKVFGMTQLRIKPSPPCFAGERSKDHEEMILLIILVDWSVLTVYFLSLLF